MAKKSSSIIRDRLQRHADELIESVIDALYNSADLVILDQEVNARCKRILTDLGKYQISHPDTVIKNRSKVEEIVDAYVALMLKSNWATDERRWYDVASKFLELAADVVVLDDTLTATAILNRRPPPQSDDNAHVDEARE